MTITFWHITPINDNREHDDQDCPCQPTVEIVPGTGTALVTHNAYDKRELREVKAGGVQC